jgi:hypothetical protein
MCNFDRVVGFLIAAKIAFLAMLALLIAAAVASGGVFSAGAAVGLMVGAIAACAVATGFFVAALAELANCRGPCDTNLDEVKTWLIATIALMAVVLGLLIALMIVAPVPVAGAVAITSAVLYLTMSTGVIISIESLIAVKLGISFGNFSACQAANARPSNSTLVTVFGILTGVGVAAGFVAGLASGTLWSVGAILLVGAILGFDVSFSTDAGSDAPMPPPNP